MHGYLDANEEKEKESKRTSSSAPLYIFCGEKDACWW